MKTEKLQQLLKGLIQQPKECEWLEFKKNYHSNNEIGERISALSNAGEPLITPARFIDEYQSRNEQLADVLRRARICEEKRSSIDKVILP